MALTQNIARKILCANRRSYIFGNILDIGRVKAI